MLKCINSARLAWYLKLQNIAPKAEIDADKTQSEAKKKVGLFQLMLKRLYLLINNASD